MLSKYRTPEDHGVFQVIALSVLGLIVVLVALVIMLRSLANMVMYQDTPPGWVANQRPRGEHADQWEAILGETRVTDNTLHKSDKREISSLVDDIDCVCDNVVIGSQMLNYSHLFNVFCYVTACHEINLSFCTTLSFIQHVARTALKRPIQFYLNQKICFMDKMKSIEIQFHWKLKR